MSATLGKQFEGYAARCLEIARGATRTAGRARFMQMAREALRISEDRLTWALATQNGWHFPQHNWDGSYRNS
jgi:hypothetical protein